MSETAKEWQLIGCALMLASACLVFALVVFLLGLVL